MDPQKIIKQETSTILNSLRKLRPHFPGKPDSEILTTILQGESGPLNPNALTLYARTKKQFSTADVMQHFQCDKYKVAASVAVLRQEGTLVPAEPKKGADGYSRWMWRGRKL